MKEIEVIFAVRSSRKEVLTALRRYKYEGIKHTIDTYFYDPLRADLKPDKGQRLQRAFRLREKSGRAYFTYKRDFFTKAGAWDYTDEQEVAVSDKATARRIIEALGLQPLLTLDMNKHVYGKPEMMVQKRKLRASDLKS